MGQRALYPYNCLHVYNMVQGALPPYKTQCLLDNLMCSTSIFISLSLQYKVRYLYIYVTLFTVWYNELYLYIHVYCMIQYKVLSHHIPISMSSVQYKVCYLHIPVAMSTGQFTLIYFQVQYDTNSSASIFLSAYL